MILPLLRPAIITVIVVSSVAIYNDFVNPLYFLPGNDNATVQLTLFNFQSQFNTRWNLLFADVLLITIPPLIMFIFFQRQTRLRPDRRRGQGLSGPEAPPASSISDARHPAGVCRGRAGTRPADLASCRGGARR